MDSLEGMYSPSIAMYPSKCVCIHASVPQWYVHLNNGVKVKQKQLTLSKIGVEICNIPGAQLKLRTLFTRRCKIGKAEQGHTTEGIY